MTDEEYKIYRNGLLRGLEEAAAIAHRAHFHNHYPGIQYDNAWDDGHTVGVDNVFQAIYKLIQENREMIAKLDNDRS